MQRISSFKTILAVVAIFLVMPGVLASFNGQVPACDPPYCPNPCPAEYTNCTYEWIMESPSNFALAMFLAAMGYTVYVCCYVD
jgi:hypothetical protein